MKTLSPMKSYPKPKYPTAVQIKNDPELLRKLPKRWRANPAVCAALVFTLTSGLYSCSSDKTVIPEQIDETTAQNFAGTEKTTTSETTATKNDEETENNLVTTLAIPIFEHGEGRGSYGCVSVAPPVYLSEEEAAQVIREEAFKMGVDFSASAKITSDKFPSTNLYGSETDETWSGDIILDGYDEKLGIGFEYVSEDDIKAWEGKNNTFLSTVKSYDMKGTDEKLSAVAKNTAMFYDPGTNYDLIDMDKLYSEEDGSIDYTEIEETLKEDRIENLRAQVREFLEWLTAEGII